MCREAKEKTGRYVMSFLNHLKKHLGVHAAVFVAYQDEVDLIKISEWVLWIYTHANNDTFLALSPRDYKAPMSLKPAILRCSRNSGIVGVCGRRIPVGVLNPILHFVFIVDWLVFKVAKKSLKGIEEEDANDDDPDVVSVSEAVPPEEHFLRRDDQGLWMLGPFPESGLRADHAKALRVYITQMWSG